MNLPAYQLKRVSGGAEAFLGIPFLGGLFILNFSWIPLFIMLALHLFVLFISGKQGKKKTGSVLGIVTSCIGWLPFIGMVMHIVTAVVLLTEAHKESKEPIEIEIPKGNY
ncbi:hypothetical protein [Alkalicoccus halolimnae]|uniref:Uncharacterized protein n=1 Tax=Alkalicoccus halolimnae TaxID=1667239 RepID=A0A5C7FAB7_9BACI|nr:hypothetical protein [Alkalicoccus halolimnae]TXF86348.1 hypothetical protein FTX54_03705 [Alkalicoccus halolimnae]